MVYQGNLLSKTLVIGIIFLFIGVAVQPSIATVEPKSIDVEYFDITTEFIGLGKEYTTQLTKEEIQELDALFDSISDSLNKSLSVEETIGIFKDAILELDRFGLLGDVGIDETEKLVISCFQNPKFMETFEDVYNKERNPLGDDSNLFCLVVGKSTYTFFSNLWNIGLLLIIIVLSVKLFPESYYNLFGFSLGLTVLFLIIDVIKPLCFGRQIFFTHNANGKILTFGLNGYKYWEGNLEGKIKSLILNNTYRGAVGFTGLKIQIVTSPNSYYLGFAIKVHIEASKKSR